MHTQEQRSKTIHSKRYDRHSPLFITFFTALIAPLLTLLLSACATFVVPDSPPIITQHPIAVVPLRNLSQTPLAADKAEQALLTLLLQHNINAATPPRHTAFTLEDIFDSNERQKATENWLAEGTFDYVLSGTVNEWGYSRGVSGDPSVSITLWLTRAQEPDTILWRATGSRIGLGYKNMTALAQDILKKLIEGIDFEN